MTEPRSDFLHDIVARGFMHQCTDLDALDDKAANETIVAYIGYDCTGPSLHVGHMVSIMMLRRMQQEERHHREWLDGNVPGPPTDAESEDARAAVPDEQGGGDAARESAARETVDVEQQGRREVVAETPRGTGRSPTTPAAQADDGGAAGDAAARDSGTPPEWLWHTKAVQAAHPLSTQYIVKRKEMTYRSLAKELRLDLNALLNNNTSPWNGKRYTGRTQLRVGECVWVQRQRSRRPAALVIVAEARRAALEHVARTRTQKAGARPTRTTERKCWQHWRRQR